MDTPAEAVQNLPPQVSAPAFLYLTPKDTMQSPSSPSLDFMIQDTGDPSCQFTYFHKDNMITA